MEQEITGTKNTINDYLYASSHGLSSGLSASALAIVVSDFFANNPIEVGLDFGIGTSALVGGINLSIRTRLQADAYAREGKKLKAFQKTAESIMGVTSAFITPGVVAGWEQGFTAGAVGIGIGSAISLLAGSGEVIRTRRALKEGRLPIIDPIQYGVTPNPDFPTRVSVIEIPPVFSAGSIGSMQRFREANKQLALHEHALRVDRSDKPHVNLPRTWTSIFEIPNATHYAVFDPDKKKRGGQMQLQDPEGKKITVNTFRNIKDFWPWESSLKVRLLEKFNEREWEALRKESWKSDIYLLAQYQKAEGSKVDGYNLKPEDLEDRYWLIDLLEEYDVDNDWDGEEEGEELKANSPFHLPLPARGLNPL